MTIVGAVLAAGSGARMGQPKAEIVVAGQRLVDRAVAAVSTGGCRPVVVIGRAGLAVSGADVVVNADPERGQRSSLELAVDFARQVHPVEPRGGLSERALAVLLVDTPGITGAAVHAVISAWKPGRIAVGTSSGRRSHPVVMSLDRWAEALRMAGADEGARRLLGAHPELIDEVAIDVDPADLDTPEQLSAWEATAAAQLDAER